MLHKELTDEILHAFYKVHYKLGYGFLEKVYKFSLYRINSVEFEM